MALTLHCFQVELEFGNEVTTFCSGIQHSWGSRQKEESPKAFGGKLV